MRTTKPDHITFLAALVLAAANIFMNIREADIAVVILLLLALVYDLYEQKTGREK